jgi:hypothetical protein
VRNDLFCIFQSWGFDNIWKSLNIQKGRRPTRAVQATWFLLGQAHPAKTQCAPSDRVPWSPLEHVPGGAGVARSPRAHDAQLATGIAGHRPVTTSPCAPTSCCRLIPSMPRAKIFSPQAPIAFSRSTRSAAASSTKWPTCAHVVAERCPSP